MLNSHARATAVNQGATGYLAIDLAAIGSNYSKLSSMLAPTRAGAVVKADAYGLGAIPVSRTLYAKGCRHFFVAHLMEALALRPELEHDAQIFVLNGLQPGSEFACAQAGLIPVLNSAEQFHRWSWAAREIKRKLPAVLQFDTGMSRLGIAPEDRPELAAAVRTCDDVKILFAMSHLACADERDSQQNFHQLAEMRRIVEEFPGLDMCFANSGGVFLGAGYHGALARTGLALYGGAPTTALGNPMQPVVHLEVAVIQTRSVPAGARVGYGGSHVATARTALATIGAGYADGLPRGLGGRGAVYFKGQRLPIVGRVSMDSITIDISALPEGSLTLGSRVEVIGAHQTLEDLARDAGTISYEILTSLGHRYQRTYC
nr:alanine racemase [Mesorhizobium sp. WSM4875]